MRLSQTPAAALIILLAATSASAADPQAAPPTPWRDNFTTRLEALALIESLNSDLLSHDSATLTLDKWCAAHALADPAKVIAERVHDADKPATAEQRQLLGVSATERLRYRHVRLRCGSHVLSEADNWYVPSRLTTQMNNALDTSDIAFGRAIQALLFKRRTLSAKLLWSPLPDGWEMSAHPESRGAKSLEVPAQVLQHQALLTLPDGTPLSEVRETYTSEVLAFPEPSAPRH